MANENKKEKNEIRFKLLKCMLKGLGTQHVTHDEKVSCLSSNGMHCDSPLVVNKLVTDRL